MTTETFVTTSPDVEIRENDDKSASLVGYAAVYNKLSVDLGGFVERIEPGAFDEALAELPDVPARVQHQGGLSTIGRTKNGTLKLESNSRGLKYTAKLPNTNAGRDIAELVKRGDIDKSSFAFTLRGDPSTAQAWNWEASPPVRTLKRLNLHDVSPVDGPAYPDTSVSARTLEAAKAERDKQRPSPTAEAKAADRAGSNRETLEKISELQVWLKQNRAARA